MARDLHTSMPKHTLAQTYTCIHAHTQARTTTQTIHCPLSLTENLMGNTVRDIVYDTIHVTIRGTNAVKIDRSNNNINCS